MNEVSRSKNGRDEEENKRESGEPGGGKGRRDEVGRSGVYPMSGPHPAGDVEIKGQASWGQGERGATGYEDHGGSALTFEYGQVLGGFDSGPGGEPKPSTAETQQARDEIIPQSQWLSFLDSFSRQHQDWLVTVEVVGDKGRLIAVHERRLEGISIDRAGASERVYVYVGATPDERVTHTVSDPSQIKFKHSQGGEDIGVEIASADGTTTIIRFRTPMRPEMLDGIAA